MKTENHDNPHMSVGWMLGDNKGRFLLADKDDVFFLEELAYDSSQYRMHQKFLVFDKKREAVDRARTYNTLAKARYPNDGSKVHPIKVLYGFQVIEKEHKNGQTRKS